MNNLEKHVRLKEVTSIRLVLVQVGVLIFILLLIGRYNYGLFQSLTVIFEAAVWFVIFSTTWSSRRFIDNNYLLVIGMASFSIGAVDVLEILSITDNKFFLSQTANQHAQLWLVSSFILSAALLSAALFIGKKIRPALWFFSFLGLNAVLSSLVIKGWLPPIYNASGAYSRFGLISEIAVIGIYLLAVWLLIRQTKFFEKRVARLLILALSLSLLAELFFKGSQVEATALDFVYHLLKVLAAYMLYLGVVETGLMKPYRVLFKNLKDHEKSLEQSEERYRVLVEHSPSAILLQVEGEIVYLNPSAVKLFGARSEKVLLGQKLFDYIPSQYHSAIAARITSLNQGRKFVPILEIMIKKVDGNLLEVATTGAAVVYGGKKAIQTVLNDISKRKKYERQLRAYTEKMEQYANDLGKFKLAVENASEAIYITDDKFEIIYANRATERTTGFYRTEIVGQTTSHWRDLSNEARVSRQLSLPGRAEKITAPLSEEVINRRKNGELYTARLEISPVTDSHGLIDYYVFIERNITIQKELDQAKSEFVSLASHQLRTPLASITLSSELFLRGVYGDLNERQRDGLNEIFDASRRMKGLIDELLNISRIELGTLQIKLEFLNLPDQLEVLLRDQQLLAQHKQLLLNKEFPENLPLVMMDRNLLEIIIDNLLSNAIRYTPAGGSITVGLERHGDDVMLWVRDTGCGIPVNQQSRVFDKLFRADNAQAISADGSGLGLYMVKAALKRIGGSIWVESVLDVGSTFFVRLPIQEVKKVALPKNQP